MEQLDLATEAIGLFECSLMLLVCQPPAPHPLTQDKLL